MGNSSDWDDGSPKNLRWGPVPQYFENYSVIGYEAKYELSKKRSSGTRISGGEIEVLGEKMINCYCI